MSLMVRLLVSLIFSVNVWASNSFVYRGALTDNSDQPIASKLVKIKVEIIGGTDCSMWEQVTPVTTDANGSFQISLTNDSEELKDVLSNEPVAATCAGGTGPYTPALGDERALKVTIVTIDSDGDSDLGDETDINVALTPNQIISAVPYAISAQVAEVAKSVAFSDVTGAPADEDSLGALNCSDGQVASWNNAAGQWECTAQGAMPAADIKTAYESNADTNAFTNAYQTQLDNFATNAVTAVGGSKNDSGTGTTDLWSADKINSVISAITDNDTTTTGGDLSGAQTNATVVKIQGSAISDASPSTGEVLKWTGTAWAPAADVDTTSTGGDLSGSLGSATVAKIQGVAVSSAAPNSGEALVYNGSQWAPSAVATSGVNLNTLSANYTVQSGDSGKDFVVTTAIDITLPSAATVGSGFSVRFKKSNVSAGVSIVPDGSELIDGVTGTSILAKNYGYAEFVSDGSNWLVLSQDGLSSNLFLDNGAYRYSDGTYASTCAEYLNSAVYANEGNGLYWLQITGYNSGAAFKGTCDMDNGGWLEVMYVTSSTLSYPWSNFLTTSGGGYEGSQSDGRYWLMNQNRASGGINYASGTSSVILVGPNYGATDVRITSKDSVSNQSSTASGYNENSRLPLIGSEARNTNTQNLLVDYFTGQRGGFHVGSTSSEDPSGGWWVSGTSGANYEIVLAYRTGANVGNEYHIADGSSADDGTYAPNIGYRSVGSSGGNVGSWTDNTSTSKSGSASISTTNVLSVWIK
jgi:hypothetical protein